MSLTASEARKNLYGRLDEASSSHRPIEIRGKRLSAVLIGLEDWRAIQETLYLLSIPGMRKSLRQGMATAVKDCAEKAEW